MKFANCMKNKNCKLEILIRRKKPHKLVKNFKGINFQLE